MPASKTEDIRNIVFQKFCERVSVGQWKEATEPQALADLYDRLVKAHEFAG